MGPKLRIDFSRSKIFQYKPSDIARELKGMSLKNSVSQGTDILDNYLLPDKWVANIFSEPVLFDRTEKIFANFACLRTEQILGVNAPRLARVVDRLSPDAISVLLPFSEQVMREKDEEKTGGLTGDVIRSSEEMFFLEHVVMREYMENIVHEMSPHLLARNFELRFHSSPESASLALMRLLGVSRVDTVARILSQMSNYESATLIEDLNSEDLRIEIRNHMLKLSGKSALVRPFSDFNF